MSHANRQQHEEKKHGDALEQALKEADEHTTGQAKPVPAADKGGHPLSAAAHLDEKAQLHHNTLQAGHSHQAMGQVNALREPPREVTRTGKDHRRE